MATSQLHLNAYGFYAKGNYMGLDKHRHEFRSRDTEKMPLPSPRRIWGGSMRQARLDALGRPFNQRSDDPSKVSLGTMKENPDATAMLRKTAVRTLADTTAALAHSLSPFDIGQTLQPIGNGPNRHCAIVET